MTRDHDSKRAIRARMKVTGERGFAVIRAFATPDEVARITAVVDDVIASTLADKQAEEEQRRNAGEAGWINVWHPGEEGAVFQRVTDHREVAWVLRHWLLRELVGAVNGADPTLRTVGALATMPGYGHQGFHADREGAAPAIGSWDATAFVFVVSPHRSATGTFRALPGSHRTPSQFTEYGSAMPPHPDEVRIEAEPGDLLVHTAYLWKSATFNGGVEPNKLLWVG